MDPFTLGSLGLTGTGIVGKLFGKKHDPSKAAQQYLNQIPGVAHENFDPWAQRGNQAGQASAGTYGQMAQNPMDFLAQILGGYQQSPGYESKQKNIMQALRNSAAAGGLAGTNYDQRQQGGVANDLLNEDMQQYLQNVLGIQGAGLQGQEYTANRGLQAQTSLADLLAGTLGSQASLGFQGAVNKNKMNNQKWDALTSLGMHGLSMGGGNGLFSGLSGFQGGGPSFGSINWGGG